MGSSHSGFRDQGEKSPGGFTQGRIAPFPGGLPVRLQGEESFVADGVFLHPPVCAVRDGVCRVLAREAFAVCGIQDVAEGHAVVIHAQGHAQHAAFLVLQADGAFVGVVHAVAAFAGNHAVVVRVEAGFRGVVQRQVAVPVLLVGFQPDSDVAENRLSFTRHPQCRFSRFSLSGAGEEGLDAFVG